MLSAGVDRSVRAWDLAEGKPRGRAMLPAPVRGLCLGKDETVLAASGHSLYVLSVLARVRPLPPLALCRPVTAIEAGTREDEFQGRLARGPEVAGGGGHAESTSRGPGAPRDPRLRAFTRGRVAVEGPARRAPAQGPPRRMGGRQPHGPHRPGDGTRARAIGSPLLVLDGRQRPGVGPPVRGEGRRASGPRQGRGGDRGGARRPPALRRLGPRRLRVGARRGEAAGALHRSHRLRHVRGLGGQPRPDRQLGPFAASLGRGERARRGRARGPHVGGERPGRQPRREICRQRQLGRDGARVGPGQTRGRGRPGRRRGSRVRGRDRPGCPAGRVGPPGRSDPALEPEAPERARPDGPHRRSGRISPSARTRGICCPPARTRRSGCGTW